jgi:hypothetical protein
VAATPVNVDNFVRAETDRMFAALQEDAGGMNKWLHHRAPAPVDHQPVIRMNRDTLYSLCQVDVARGVKLTVPDAGDRYLSVMVVNQDHYINRVFHDAGEYDLSVDEFDTRYVHISVRILADPADAADIANANALQDQLGLQAGSSEPFEMRDYDQESWDQTRAAILQLGKGEGFDVTVRAFGKKEIVHPVHHLICTAAGWGGLPETEAKYLTVYPNLPGDAEYKITVGDVPVDGFWSISVYNADGFFEQNDRNSYSFNNLTAKRDDDGSVTIHFGGADDRSNLLPIMDGWNYTVRLYRPHPEILSGDWTFPEVQPA